MPRIPTLLCLGAVLVAAAAPAQAQAGGEDRLLYTVAPADNVRDLRLVATSGGVLLAVLEVEADYGTPDQDTSLEFHRSLDGGETWAPWGVIGDADPLSVQRDPCLRLVQTPAGERVLLAYLDTATGAAEAVVALADPLAAAPAWSLATMIPAGTGAYSEPEVVQDPDDPSVLYGIATWLFIDVKLVFTRSVDGGLTWSTPEVIHDTSGSLHQQADLAAGPGGRVHVAVSDAPGASAPRDVWVRSAGNQAATLADWEAPVRVTAGLSDPTYFANYLSICASPDGPLVAVARSGRLAGTVDNTYVTVSPDGGVTWSGITAPTRELPAVVLPVLTWTGDDFAMVVSPDDPNAGFLDVVRPDAGYGVWTRTPIIDRPSTRGAATVTADHSRGGQLAVLARRVPPGAPDRILFDAEWRAGPGRGVSQAPWWHDLGAAPAAALGTGDVNGDAVDDVLVALDDGRVLGLRLDGPTSAHFDVDLTPARAASPPAAADLDGDGWTELVVGGDDGRVHAFDRWDAPLPGFPVLVAGDAPCFVSLGPVGADPTPRIVAIAGTRLVVLDAAGAPLPGFPRDLPAGDGAAEGPVALGDVNADGAVDLVVCLTWRAGVVGGDGLPLATLHTGVPRLSGGASLADLDQDGDLEIALPHHNGHLMLREHDGTPAPGGWPLVTGAGPAGPLAIAVVEDGAAFSLAAATGAGVGWLAADATIRLQVPGGPGVRVADPVLVDVGQAGGGVLLPDLRDDATGTLWREDATAQATWPRDLDGPVRVGAAAGDVDGDGVLELVLAQGDSLAVLDLGVAVPTDPRSSWPMVGHDLRRSGCADCPDPDLTTAVAGAAATGAAAPAPLRILGAAPNPFNPRTEIRFATGNAGPVLVRVLDLRGRLVRELLSAQRPAGVHAVAWDGRDQAGRGVAAGRYAVQVQAAGRSAAVGVVMVK